MHRSAIALLLAALAMVFSAAPAAARPRTGLHAKHHARIVHSPARLRPPQPKDPYADYWNDPSRQGFPSWGLTGNRKLLAKSPPCGPIGVFRRSVKRFAAENASNSKNLASNSKNLEHDPIPSERIML